MGRTRVKGNDKSKITLSVDAKLWAECREMSKQYGVVWSQVAEQAFLATLLQLKEVEKVVQSASDGAGNLDTSIIKSQLQEYIGHASTALGIDFEELSRELEVQIPD